MKKDTGVTNAEARASINMRDVPSQVDGQGNTQPEANVYKVVMIRHRKG